MASSNPALIYKQVPQGEPVPSQDIVVEDIDSPSEAPEGGLLVQVLYSSLDPYLRGLLRDPKIPSYFPPLETGNALRNSGIAKVLKSSSADFKEGDIIVANLPIQRYAQISSEVVKSAKKIDADPNDKSFDIRHYVGALGMPGLTGYSGFYEIGKPKKGETIFVSSAAGAVGQVVGQLAKHEGLKVIGSVGSDEKLKYITSELGFDSGFNYKKEKPADALKRLAPKGIDIYFENVGSDHLDAAIESMNTFGRIIACGMVAEYNAKSDDERHGHKKLMLIVGKQLTMRGFLVNEDPDLGPKHSADHQKNVKQWLKDGSFTAKVHEYDISEADKGFVGMLRGENFGKAVVKTS
ncbi:hypothetical protein LTR05_007960 [Lithohypha guttulata]|uniref:Enoyl reductase (ER) domain-containing protein n=1 Tax=Lithohypha guttulata TaxID=1690604 RepID=A0AAN7STJ0_9EURO|nr:hypothetical protein LTR05_007960 [Lithohypha guttulata]